MLPLLLAAAIFAQAPAPQLPSPERSQQLLFEAARAGRADLIPALIAAGADVNAYDPRGFTALILAAYNGQAQAVDVLLARGADPCKPDRGMGSTAQMGVAFKGDDAIAARLLKTRCDVNARNKSGQTALMMAALFARTRQIAMLRAAGADASIVDNAGNTASSVAAAQGSAAIADALRR